nr:retrovirus-related Pol polyprotein from transposon TNT 1-94 [Tanacetum cinerariifolium]
MARQYTQPKRPRNSTWFKEKMLLVQAHKSGQTDDIDASDSDCDDISSAKAVLMANLSSYDLDILFEVPQHETYQNDDMINQSVESFKDFDNGLHNEIDEVKMVFNQMEAAFEQCFVDKKCFDIQKKEFFLKMIDSWNILSVKAEAVVIACYTQNQSLIYKRHNKKKPDLSYLHVFCALCYSTNDSEDIGKLKPKADTRIIVGYAPTKKAYQIYKKRTRLIIKSNWCKGFVH